MLINLPQFIARHVTGRNVSLFQADLDRHHDELSRQIVGKSVLVIGGAGSIGSAFIKALLPFQPARLFVIDHNENGLTELVRDLRSGAEYFVPTDLRTYALDFADPVFDKLFLKEGPFDIVANFAAHKHVRSEKDPYAIEAMIGNNVFRAKHLLDLLAHQPPLRFFCVSTDKAAEPANVMGATKKLMEEVALAYAAVFPVCTARFANVAFSNGSLPAGFLERLQKRQPLSAPRDVLRYFIAPEEAGQLCLLACMLGKSGEIFFPKLDIEKDTRSFPAIAEALLAEFGFTPDICHSEATAREKARHITGKTWPVYYFNTDTSGEKACETFSTEDEKTDLNRFESLGVILPAQRWSMLDLVEMLEELRAVLHRDEIEKADIVKVLERLTPGFRHLETGKSLDEKM
jgi:FlaA1/EpsC-like NDP-sugar epimerase